MCFHKWLSIKGEKWKSPFEFKFCPKCGSWKFKMHGESGEFRCLLEDFKHEMLGKLGLDKLA
jgi:hypothetical protein